MRVTNPWRGTILLAAALTWVGCSARGTNDGASTPGKSGGSGGSLSLGMAGTLSLCDPALDPACSPDAPAPPGCGDGVLTEDEACDDGNRSAADGCAANCLSVERGFSCTPPGAPCHPIAKCGDGVVVFPEACDDGGNTSGDGCNERCKLEIGYKCRGSPSTCSATTCGDGQVEGAESCDDGNALPFDGCSGACQAEPDCSQGACSSRCGDGLVLNEECDDGNAVSGDGCSSACIVEPGYQCSQDLDCAMRGDTCILEVPAVFRDFAEAHPDFEVNTDSCPGDAAYQMSSNPAKGWAKGLVLPNLAADGKPELDPAADALGKACIASSTTFHEWYHDAAVNTTIASSVVLWDRGDGSFVNRHGPNGEQWAKLEGQVGDIRACGNRGTACASCTLAANEKCWDPCVPWGDNHSQACAAPVSYVDGNPLFFPVDPGTDATATVPPAYWNVNYYVDESRFEPGAGPHNFYFTTEIKYWFRFDPGATATLDFTGDDDVWVFVNGKLAVDLGGLHAPINGSVTLSASNAADYGLAANNVYAISVFHAERKKQGSSMRLTLSGFTTARSECVAVCGDGIIGLGEQCDDGINDGGYGECEPGCVLGAHCGDGIEQPGEQCDDGNNIDGDGCGSGCRNVVVK